MDINEIVDEVARRFHAKGERMGRVRKNLVTALAQADTPLSVDQLHEILPQNPHRATLYRSLSALADIGVVQETQMGTSSTLYRLADMEHRVVFAQCRTCGELLQLPKSVVDTTKVILKENYGFQLHSCHVALAGKCKKCQEEQSGS